VESVKQQELDRYLYEENHDEGWGDTLTWMQATGMVDLARITL
jgi:hypothetical protein